jgi:hypothetical protein
MKKQLVGQRFFIGTDQDCHAYIVPADKRTEWEVWNELDQTTSAAWKVPKWAKAIGCHPTRITFTDPKED